MFEGDLRGRRSRSPAGSLETRLKAGGGAGAAGFWEEPSGSLGPHARRALGWPLRGIHLRCEDGTRALGRENLPRGPHVDGWAGFVSGAAPPLPAGS